MPKEEEPPQGAPEWMCTFSDMMSLLLCFFVLLFSLSTIEKKKAIQAIGSLRGAFGGLPAPYVLENIPNKHTKPEMSRPAQTVRRTSYATSELVREEKQKVQSMKLQSVIQVTGTEQGITFRITGDFVFDPGQYKIKPDALIALKFIASELIQFPSNPIKIDGHTDASGDADANFILAANRAYAVLEFLRDIGCEWGQVEESRMSYESFGEYAPLHEADTPISQSLNRRVEITLLQSDEGDGTFFLQPDAKNPRTPLMEPLSVQ
ncbi:MAG: hypothetical protein C4527_07195 [Candidatus Omnitrophota bacterium]|jgi:chemotaxis protein MotB|nr:MAG: hypothetical protein C4527_07195 [Candidatus Omnitrophota bacterium]